MEPEHTSITTQEQYDTVATRIEQLKDVSAGSEEAKELKQLTKQIVDYERRQQRLVGHRSKGA